MLRTTNEVYVVRLPNTRRRVYRGLVTDKNVVIVKEVGKEVVRVKRGFRTAISLKTYVPCLFPRFLGGGSHSDVLFKVQVLLKGR